jgi:hypothetical protein
MSTPESDKKRQQLDEATSRRLAKLRTAPVDTSGLLKAVEAQIPRSKAHPRRLKLTWLSPMRAAAASLLVLGLIVALVINSSSGPVLASAERLAHIHEEVLAAGGNHVTPVDSIGAANVALAAKWPGAPSVPELPRDHVMSCCIHTMGRKKIVCVAFQTDGVPITMAVAQAADVKLPASETLSIGGVTYYVQSRGGINMVMTERGGRWVCLMGKLPVNRLAELASSLRF